MKFLQKLLVLSALTTIVIAQSCPPLQPPEGVVFQCIDSSNNGTLDCLSGNITKGALAQYRCKNESDTNWANSTMKCCRGRWKGLDAFNEFANSSCSSLPMILPQSNSTGPDENESSTQPTNMEGNETSSSTSSSTALTSNDTSSPAPPTGNTTNSGNSTDVVGSTEPTIEKSRAIDLTKGVSNSSDAGNATTTPQSDPASNASLPLSLTTSDNSSLTTTPSPSGDNLNASLSSSSPAPSDPGSTVSNSSDSSSSSSSTISSLATTTPMSSENSSPLTSESSSGSSTTPASGNGSTSSNDTSTQMSSTTSASTADNSSTTTAVSTSSSQPTPSNSSETSTTVPSVAGETTGQIPPTNTTLIIDDTESRQSKDLKLSPGATGNATKNGTSDNSNSTVERSTPAIPTVGASLTITNSSTASNSSGGESTTTPSPANSSTTSSSSSSGAPSSSSSAASDSTSTTIAPENLSNGNGSAGRGDGNSTTDFKTLALNLHNKLRTSHRCQPLVLNETLNQIAQSWAENLMNQSKLVATPGKRSYSENLFKISGGDKISETEAIEGALKSWSSSKSWFNYTNPKPTGFSQILWNATTQLGIGLASGNDSTIVVATYYPRGNIVSKADPNFYFKKNVFPEISNATQVSPVTGNSTSTTDGQNTLTNNSTTTT